LNEFYTLSGRTKKIERLAGHIPKQENKKIQKILCQLSPPRVVKKNNH